MDTLGSATDLVVPNFSLLDAVKFAAFALIVIFPAGAAICRIADWRIGRRIERYTLQGVAGVVWISLLFWALLFVERAHWALWLMWAPVVVELARVRSVEVWRRRIARSFRALTRAWAPAQLVSLAVLAALLTYQQIRIASLVEIDAAGLKLYGAFYSDKFTSMSAAAALRYNAPPECLRLAGYAFPNHYLPHLFVAAVDRMLGIDYLDGYWFHVFALGALINCGAVLAFCRRFVPGAWSAPVALALYAIFFCGPEAKTLDLSPALLLLGLLSADRAASSLRSRWTVLAAASFGLAVGYEVHLAATVIVGLGAWWSVSAASFAASWYRNRQIATLQWRSLGRQTCLVALAALISLTTLKLLYSGAEAVCPPRLVFSNSYRDSFTHDLRDWGQDSHLANTVYHWKRGKLVPDSVGAPKRKAAAWQRIGGTIAFYVAFAAYFLARFVNAAIFGWMYFWSQLRSGVRDWSQGESMIFAIAATGYAIPMLILWGHHADGGWWATPNIYRLTNCGFLLMLLCGVGVLREVLARSAPAPRAVPFAIFLFGSTYAAWHDFGLQPQTTYHFVDRDRLAAIAFLRTEVPFGERVIHPWIDDLIRDRRANDAVTFVYKQHCTLASNLAGQKIYFEGRKDHLFINGFVDPADVDRRCQQRLDFYSDRTDAIAEVIGAGEVRWVLADQTRKAPSVVSSEWEAAYQNATVKIYRAPASDRKEIIAEAAVVPKR